MSVSKTGLVIQKCYMILLRLTQAIKVSKSLAMTYYAEYVFLFLV